MTEFGAHPQRLDLTVHAGDPISISIPVIDSLGVAQSLSGWSASAQAVDASGAMLYDFAASIVSDTIRVAATPAQTGAWNWPGYAARLVVTGTPSGGSPTEIAVGWIRLYRP